MRDDLPPEVVRFADQVGLFIEYWGFKRVQGEFWAYLYVSSVPLTTVRLMELTGVSKGLTSIYLREMLDYGVIEACSAGPNGASRYRAVKNQTKVIFNVLRRREQVMLNSVQSSLGVCRTLPEEELERHRISKTGLKRAAALVDRAVTILSFIVHGKITGALCERVFGLNRKEPKGEI